MTETDDQTRVSQRLRLTATSHATKYVLVRHSAWTVGRDACFQRAVESAAMQERTLVALLEREEAVLWFDDWAAGEEAEAQTNYPAGVAGLIPRTAGSYRQVAAGRGVYDVYVPTDDEHLAWRTARA